MHETLISNYSQEAGRESCMSMGPTAPTNPAHNFCHYFQALVIKQKTWFFVATLRGFEHLCFDRTLEKSEGRFEFFVPASGKDTFIKLMRWYESQGIVSDFQELPNRFAEY